MEMEENLSFPSKPRQDASANALERAEQSRNEENLDEDEDNAGGMKFKPAPKVSFYSRDQAIMILKVLNTYLVKNQRSGDVNYTTAKFYSINYRRLLNFHNYS